MMLSCVCHKYGTTIFKHVATQHRRAQSLAIQCKALCTLVLSHR
nr:MAG TPA: hypothetical protein [Caudoviricetes sp.]